MRASVIIVRSEISGDREIIEIRRRRKIRTLAPKTKLPFICILNGAPLLRNDWGRCVEDGDILGFVIRPLGGGGGGSNPLQLVAMIALTYFTMGAGAALWMPAGMAGTLGGAVLGGVAQMAGSALINSLMGSPKQPSPMQAQALAAPSPTYSIGAQGNSSRIGQAIPELFGRHLVFPDFGAEPYTEFAGNEQYLYQLFVIGRGQYDIEQLRIEDTALASFPEVTYEVLAPGAAVTLFPVNVTTAAEVAGQELLTDAAIGPFIVNPSGSQTNAIAVDVVAPKGLFYANDQGALNSLSIVFKVEARPVDASGAPVAPGTWTTLGTETLTAATNTPQRNSYRYSVALARYEVKVTRTDTKDTGSRAGHDLVWSSARAYLPGGQSYPDVTTLAMRIRASNSLSSQSSRRFNMIATRKLPIWNGTSWSAPTATRSIAWALAYICKTRMTDDRYDLVWLLAKDATWTARGDHFDAIFDAEMTFGEALSSCARAGRAKWFQHGMVIRFLRDEPATLPVALFNVRNTVRGSFKTDYIMSGDETADAVIIEYFDADKWAPDQVLCQLPGHTADKPATLKLFGVTSRAQAYREGMYEAACNRYRRMLPSLTTEMEGFIPLPGDLVAIQRDKPGWGQGGDVLAYNAGTKTLTLSEPLVWTTGQHYFGFKLRDGSMSTPWNASPGADAYHAVLTTALNFTPDTDTSRERTSYAFGPSTSFYQQVRVISPRPRSMERVDLMFVNEDAAVHTADTGSVPAASTQWNLPAVISRPVVEGINVTLGGTSGSPLTLISWKPAQGANDYVIETSEDAGQSWTRAGESKTSNYTLPAKIASIGIRISAIGLLQGDWAVWTGNVYAYPPANVTGFAVTPTVNGAVLSWNNVADVDLKDYEIRVGASFAAGAHVGFFPGTSTPPLPLAAGSYTWWIVARDILLNPSNAAEPISLTVNAPAAPAVLASVTDTDYLLSWAAPASTWAIDYYQIYVGSTFGTATLVASPKSTVFQNPVDFSGTRNFFIRAVDRAGNIGSVTQASISITAPVAPTVTAQVIDNNVLLYWTESAQTLPIDTYQIRRGAVFASAEVIGTKSGLFTSLFETAAGTYTYWVVGIDSASNPGTPGSTAVTVSQPPDYVLKADHNSTFSGTKSNMAQDADGSWITPVNTTETWQQHFVNHSWATPQDQVNAGYALFIQPNSSPGYYEETIDYGTVMASNRITVTLNAQAVVGTVTKACTISVSANGSTWTDYTNVWEVYATSFRYAKVRVTFTAAAATDLLRVVGLNIRLDSKLKTITRMVSCVAGDSGGTIVYMTDDGTSAGVKLFLDVDAIDITPQATTPVIPVYDFTDAPDPLSLKILLFNISGTRVSGTASLTVRGF